MHPHKITKAMWVAIKTMHENANKAFVVVLNQIFYKLEIKEDETFIAFLTNFKATKPINQRKRLPYSDEETTLQLLCSLPKSYA